VVEVRRTLKGLDIPFANPLCHFRSKNHMETAYRNDYHEEQFFVTTPFSKVSTTNYPQRTVDEA